jgi:hypothetical protein
VLGNPNPGDAGIGIPRYRGGGGCGCAAQHPPRAVAQILPEARP